MEGKESKDERKRIILWTLMRSVSSAFYAAMYNRPRTKCYFEPYFQPLSLGPNRPTEFSSFQPLDEKVTYESVTKEIGDYKDKDTDVVFVKDFAFNIMPVYGKDTLQHLPKNFQHTFLIRTPYKTVPSDYKVMKDPQVPAYPTEIYNILKKYNPYKCLYELYQQVAEQHGEPPVVIDGDDLTDNPEGILRAYCARCDISYDPAMLEWKHDPKDMDMDTNFASGWFTYLFKSRTITPQTSTEGDNTDISGLPQELQKHISDALPYYEKLHALRLKID